MPRKKLKPQVKEVKEVDVIQIATKNIDATQAVTKDVDVIRVATNENIQQISNDVIRIATNGSHQNGTQEIAVKHVHSRPNHLGFHPNKTEESNLTGLAG